MLTAVEWAHVPQIFDSWAHMNDDVLDWMKLELNDLEVIEAIWLKLIGFDWVQYKLFWE